MILFLELNGIHLNITDNDIVKAGLGVADGSMKFKELLEWILMHK